MMKVGFFAPKGALEKKPPHGAPCTRCGLCCVATLCPRARFIFGREIGPCPALEYDEKGSVCGLVAHPCRHALRQTLNHGPEKMVEAAKVLVGSGTGCDARFNGEPINEAFYAELEKIDRRDAAKIKKAKKVWGVE